MFPDFSIDVYIPLDIVAPQEAPPRWLGTVSTQVQDPIALVLGLVLGMFGVVLTGLIVSHSTKPKKKRSQ
jgi:hypothetical protein